VNRGRQLIGNWRIVESEMWDSAELDLMVPAHLRLEAKGLGHLEFIAIRSDVDYRLTTRDGASAVEFTWHGDSEGDEIFGRGWAVLKDDQLQGQLFIHQGDESTFVAIRSPSGSKPRVGRRPAVARTARG
jgi:hypothetical protein